MELDERSIFYSVLGFMFVKFVWEFYLDIRQSKVLEKNKTVPYDLIGVFSKETFEKSRLYAIDKRNFNMVQDSISIVVNLLFLTCNGLNAVWELSGTYINYFGYESIEKNEMLNSAAFMLILNFLSIIIDLPLSLYKTFVLEEKHGFNKQTISFFMKDKLKMYVVQQVLLLPLLCGIIYIVKIGGNFFFLYMWLFIVALTIFIYIIYPDFIAPIFDKYVPLPAGELRNEIEKFAQTLNFPLSELYVVAGSMRSAHSNAYFYGFFKKKRIVLFDTLLKDFDINADEKKQDGETEVKKSENEVKKGCDNYEVLAILGHEFGHWKLNHTIKNIIITELNLLLVCATFAKLFKSVALYRAFGFYNSTPVLIGFLIVLQYVLSPYFQVLKYLMAILSRRFEFQADKFAKSHGRGNYLKKALIKLFTDNLEFPIYDGWYSKWYNSHPTLLERLQALDKNE